MVPSKTWHEEVLMNEGEMNMRGEARGHEYCPTTRLRWYLCHRNPYALLGAAAGTVWGEIIYILVEKV